MLPPLIKSSDEYKLRSMAEARVRAVAPPSAGRARLGLATLASASFVYVTAETLPIGLLPQIAGDLHVARS